MVGAGASEGSLDASNMLKPMLARGELHTIGATTLDEYRKHIEKDAALERRFQPVMVGEPTVEDTISILRGLRERYELHHKVGFKDAALVSAAVLSHRYITDRFLPDKAIDLIDEAASTPAHGDRLDAGRARRGAAAGDAARDRARGAAQGDRQASQERLQKLEKELADLKEQQRALTAHWNEEKEAIQKSAELKEELDALKREVEAAQRHGDYARASELQYGRIPALEAEIKAQDARLGSGGGPRLLKEQVDEEDIAEVVAKWTGIPVSRLLEGEVQKLIQMEDRLHQPRRSARTRRSAPSPTPSAGPGPGCRTRSGRSARFMFLGPTGVGKTELARALAEFLFDDEHAMIRIDMSEYQEKHTVSRMIGAPPGYVGYDEAGQLTEAVRRRPYAVVLFDEVEKAHPEVLNVLLQLLDDGRLTDGKGRTVDFRNAVVIMTSNLGSQYIAEQTARGGAIDEAVRRQVTEALRSHFRPEFLNRIDETIVFHALSKDDIAAVIDIQLAGLLKRLAERKIRITLTPEAKAALVEEGYDPIYGARPLKRTIQRRILDPLALRVLDGAFTEGDHVVVDRGVDGLVFSKGESRAPERASGRPTADGSVTDRLEGPPLPRPVEHGLAGGRRPGTAGPRPGADAGPARAADSVQRVQAAWYAAARSPRCTSARPRSAARSRRPTVRPASRSSGSTTRRWSPISRPRA